MTKTKEQIEWSQEQLDIVLNLVLKADSMPRYKGLVQIASSQVGKSYEATDRILWGLASRISSWDYEPGPSREARLEASYADILMIKRAANSSTQDDQRKKGPADPEYMSKVLCLPIEVVTKLWNTYGPAKGRRGFFS